MSLSNAGKIFFRTYQHLLFKSQSFSIVVKKMLRKFFEGISEWPADFRKFIDDVFLDVFPENTRELDAWEHQFGILQTLNNESDRRMRLDAQWKAIGGQSPAYIQDVLRSAGFDVYVHEWWFYDYAANDAINMGDPLCQMGEPEFQMGNNNQIRRFTRDPRNYISGIISFNDHSIFGDDSCQMGEPDFQMGNITTPSGTVLVNKILVAQPDYTDAVSFGDDSCQMGEPDFQMGNNNGISFVIKPDDVPSDPDSWVHFWYVGSETFPNHASVPISRKDEFETLTLKIKPRQSWVGLLIDYE